MSEIQHYDFLAIDKLLDASSQRDLRDISSRAMITANSFSNEYNYGDLRGDPIRMLARWFDVYVYTGFYSVRQFAMKLPAHLVDRAAIEQFSIDDEFLTIQEAGDNLIVDVLRNELELDWSVEDDGWLPLLAPLRAAVLEGDLRFFYLLWLMQVGFDDFMDEDAKEPLPGIGPLDDTLTAWGRFLCIDPDLVAAAAERTMPSHEPARDKVEAWLGALPEAEQRALLLQFYDGNSAALQTSLRRRVRDAIGVVAKETMPRRSAAELIETAGLIRDRNVQAEAERRLAEERRLAAERAAVDAQRRHTLQSRTDAAIWREIEDAIALRNPKGYDSAVEMIGDLRVLGRDPQGFRQRVAQLRDRHASKRTFVSRLTGLGL